MLLESMKSIICIGQKNKKINQIDQKKFTNDSLKLAQFFFDILVL